jgi:hypothetical protein
LLFRQAGIRLDVIVRVADDHEYTVRKLDLNIHIQRFIWVRRIKADVGVKIDPLRFWIFDKFDEKSFSRFEVESDGVHEDWNTNFPSELHHPLRKAKDTNFSRSDRRQDSGNMLRCGFGR